MMMGLKFICLSSIFMSSGLRTLSSILKALNFAEVVKLANTLRSGRSGRKLLRVQLPPSAPGTSQRLSDRTNYKAVSGGFSGNEKPERGSRKEIKAK